MSFNYFFCLHKIVSLAIIDLLNKRHVFLFKKRKEKKKGVTFNVNLRECNVGTSLCIHKPKPKPKGTTDKSIGCVCI